MAAGLPTGRPGQALALALTGLVLAAVWLGAISPAFDWFDGREQSLRQREALAARMAILAESVPTLKAEADSVAARGPAPRTLLDGPTDAVAGATLQERIQEMAAQAGATLTSVETLPAEQADAYRRVGVRVTMTTKWPVLMQLLEAIEQATPRMLVDDLQIESTPMPVQQTVSQLSAFFTVFAFRAASPATTAAPTSAAPTAPATPP